MFLDRVKKVLILAFLLTPSFSTKAFDTVPHGPLLRQLGQHGITGDLREWIADWLTDRKQRVCIGNYRSAWLNVTSGVPQGSILGPILFLIFINDIDQGISSDIFKFADDTKILKEATTCWDMMVIQEDLDKLSQLSRDWQMKFNADKCKKLHLGYNNNKVFRYYINN